MRLRPLAMRVSPPRARRAADPPYPAARRSAPPAPAPGRRAGSRRRCACPTSTVPSSLSSHQSPRSRRTGSIPSYCSPLAEGDERAGADQPDHLALEHARSRSPPPNSSRSSRKQRATSSASRSIIIASRSRVEVHGPGRGHPATRRAPARPATADSSAAVADQVRIAPDRRGEVAVARRLQPGVAEVARVVVGLLERAQHEAGQRPAAVAGPRHPVRDQLRGLADHVGGLLGGQVAARAPAASARRARPAARPAAPPRSPPGRSWTRYSVGIRRSLEQAAPPARWRRSSGARSAGGTRSAPTGSARDDVAVAVEARTPARRTRARAPPRPRAPRAQRRGRRPGRRQRRAPRLRRRARRRRRSGRPGRSPAARRSGSPSGRTTRAAHPARRRSPSRR